MEDPLAGAAPAAFMGLEPSVADRAAEPLPSRTLAVHRATLEKRRDRA
ncbi:MAG: hypothetical protein JWO42_2329 [Chloroflexi bacterium]|jgi:hypothetical protein|nr:hypothetical protein [Chloroflexota bacterium]